MKVGIINYGVGNLGSVYRALESMGYDVSLLEDPSDIAAQDRLILPGVGNFSECMRLLVSRGWDQSINEQALGNAKPLLGICLGMQLLADYGMEGSTDANGTPGLGLISGSVQDLSELGCGLRLPHMGWNSIKLMGDAEILREIPESSDFYFVHSYGFKVTDQTDLHAVADYGCEVAAVIGRNHIWGTQFHPEKSSKAGFKLLQSFVENSYAEG